MSRKSALLLIFAIGCALEFEYGAAETEDTGMLVLPGGSIDFESFTGEVHELTQDADTSPLADPAQTHQGLWQIDVLAGTSTPPIPSWELPAGDWQELQLGATLSSEASPFVLTAQFFDEMGQTHPVRVEFSESMTLTLHREGLTRLDEDLSFTLVERLAPIRWFPTVNLTNLEAQGDGTLLVSPTVNPVVYDQIRTALDHSARDWLDP